MNSGDRLGLLGTTLDERIVIEAVVGEGGFGVVYRGWHLGFEEPVAVKCLKIPALLTEVQRDDVVRRFKGEARILHRLSRKTAGIVQALDVGAWVSPTGVWTPYIVMEWLDGVTLEDDLERRSQADAPPLSIAEAVALLTPVADALGVAHGHNVAHLDVKPANLFLAVDGDEVVVKILDFGVAKVLAGSKSVTRALTGTQGPRAFTPQYAAPEQFDRRHGRVGPHTDVFALGLILTEMVSGKRAVRGDSPLQLYVNAVNELTRPTFASVGVAANPATEEVLRCALAVQPAERFGDAVTMWQALLRAIGANQDTTRLVPPSIRVRPDDLAATKTATSVTTTGHNRLCTILVAELRPSKALTARLDPEMLSDIVNRCLHAPRRAIEELGGMVYEQAGGRLVAIFGLEHADLNAAERAVVAAIRTRDEVARFKIPHRALSSAKLGVRIGVHTGRVYVSVEQLTRVTGTPITLATELQQRAAVDTILIGRDTQREVAGLFDLETVSLAPLDEDESPVTAHLVRGVAKSRHDLGKIARIDFLGVQTRFVGRDTELGRLNGAMDAVLDDEVSRRLIVLGERGLGKSRLLVEIASRLRSEGFFVLCAPCHATGAQASYSLAANLIRTQFHLHEDESAERAVAKLRAGIRALRPTDPAERTASTRSRPIDLEDILAPILSLLGLGPSVSSDVAASHEPERMHTRIAAAVSAMLEVQPKPVAILCDDVQWADPASLTLIDELVLRASRGMLVIDAAQPTVRNRHPTWADDNEREHIELRPFRRRQLEQMARDRLRRASAVPDTLVAELTTRAEGNPLVLVEMMHLLVDAGAIVMEGDTWEINPDAAQTIELPTTVQAIVQTRLDRLSGSARELLCHAAVVGRTFWTGALGALMDQEPESLMPTIRQLLARELVRDVETPSLPGERELVFAEASTREVAYEMLGASARRGLHLRIAEWLEARLQTDAHAATIAEHYERAGSLVDAAEAFARAGRHAASLGQTASAEPLFERACHLDDLSAGAEADDDELIVGWDAEDVAATLAWPERVHLRYDLADVLRLSGQVDGSEAALASAREHIDASGEPVEVAQWQARIGYRLAVIREVRGEVDEALATVHRAMAHADVGGILEEKAQMLALVAALEQRRKDDATSEQACLQGLRVLRGVKHRSPRWAEAAERLLRTLGGVLYRRGRYVSAERCYLQGLRLIDTRAYPHLASRISNNVAATRYARGDIEAARESFKSALDLAERAGEMWMAMTALNNLGEVELALGHAEVAVTYLKEAVDIGERIGAASDLADAYRNLAATRHALGRSDLAIGAAERALTLATAPAGRVYLPSVVETLIAIACTAGGESGAHFRRQLLSAAAELDPQHRAIGERCVEALAKEH